MFPPGDRHSEVHRSTMVQLEGAQVNKAEEGSVQEGGPLSQMAEIKEAVGGPGEKKKETLLRQPEGRVIGQRRG